MLARAAIACEICPPSHHPDDQQFDTSVVQERSEHRARSLVACLEVLHVETGSGERSIDDADAESIVRRQSMLHGTLPCSEAATTEHRRSRGRGVRRHGAQTRRRSNGPTSPSRRRLDGVLTHHPCSATRDGGCHVIAVGPKIVPLIEDGDEGGSAGAKHGGRLIKYRARVGFTRL